MNENKKILLNLRFDFTIPVLAEIKDLQDKEYLNFSFSHKQLFEVIRNQFDNCYCKIEKRRDNEENK